MDNICKSSRREYFKGADLDVAITVWNEISRDKMHLIEEAVDELFNKVQKIANGDSVHHSEEVSDMKITDLPLGMQIEFC